MTKGYEHVIRSVPPHVHSFSCRASSYVPQQGSTGAGELDRCQKTPILTHDIRVGCQPLLRTC